jgi:amidase
VLHTLNVSGARDDVGTERDWAALDATAQAACVARGEITPTELVATTCRRIAQLDGLLGAVPVRTFATSLLRAADMAPGSAPFAGVPFLMKDVGARQAGHPYYAGNRALRDADHRADRDTPLGARFRELGLVTVGSSSTPEFGLQSSTWPLAYGPARNPWDPMRTPGGSSGGAAAAVAAGLVPVAHASDGAGSIRIPAAWCGLIGLKPTRDRIVWRHAGRGLPEVEFVLARSLRDTLRCLDLLQASRPRLPWLPGGRTLRVAFLTHSPAGVPVHPACRAAVESAARTLAALGHDVCEAAPDSLFEYEDRALQGAVHAFTQFKHCLEELEIRLDRPVGPGDVEPFLWELAALGSAPPDLAAAERAEAWHCAWVARTLRWFEDFDVLLTPTVGEPAPRLDSLDPSQHAPLELLEKLVLHMAFTEPWNSTGQPALSLPLGLADGLPIGVQLVGPTDCDELLLDLAAPLLDAAPALSRPPIHA